MKSIDTPVTEEQIQKGQKIISHSILALIVFLILIVPFLGYLSAVERQNPCKGISDADCRLIYKAVAQYK